MQEKFKEKLGVDFKRYIILGAWNPSLAYKALQTEEMIGTMLPCNFVITDKENGYTGIAAVNPEVSMIVVRNPELETLAHEVTGKLKNVFDLLKLNVGNSILT